MNILLTSPRFKKDVDSLVNYPPLKVAAVGFGLP
jgi:hypothetical protein